jgi:signal transduction histidine kinase
MKNSRWLFAGFGIATLWLGFSTAVSYRNTERIVYSAEQSLKSYEIIKNLADVFTSMTVAESGRRGYIFLNDRQELDRYTQAIAQLQTELAELRHQLEPQPQQAERLAVLMRLVQQRLALLHQSINLYQTDPSVTPEQIAITQQSVALRDQIQQQLSAMEAIEEATLKQGLSESQSSIRARNTIEIVLTTSIMTTMGLGLIALYRQVARRQTAENQQQQLAQQTELNEMKLRFFSMVSHEFRTPLTVILGSTQLMLEKFSSDQSPQFTAGNSLQRIQTAAKSMVQLLNDMLTLTRADAGKLEYRPHPIELVSFCLNLIEDINLATAGTDRIQFLNQTTRQLNQSTLNYAALDEKLLYSLLSNLLANALKYDPAEQPVQLVLAGDEASVEFTVSDRGIGISRQNQARLYEPFYRGDNVQSIAGTGLGLAVVKRCVELQSGEILVESQEGQGTTVHVKLPRYLAEPADHAPQSDQPSGLPPTRPD